MCLCVCLYMFFVCWYVYVDDNGLDTKGIFGDGCPTMKKHSTQVVLFVGTGLFYSVQIERYSGYTNNNC